MRLKLHLPEPQRRREKKLASSNPSSLPQVEARYMISKKDFRKINDYLWEIPKSFRADTKVSVKIYIEFLKKIYGIYKS